MPTYDYECKKCDHKFEIFQSIKDKPLADCPQCKGELRRLIGGGMGIIFKGNGFYSTDYKKSSTSTSTSSSKESRSKANTNSKETNSKEVSSDGSSKDGTSKDGSSKDGSSKDDASKTAPSSQVKAS
jgi:putative FmdB family regulatory protein